MLSLVDPKIERYVTEHTEPPPELLERLRTTTLERTERPQMQVGPVEGRFLRMLVETMGARRVLEIGTFTGYSALMMALGLPEDGTLVTCEVDPEVAAIAQRFFDESGHGGKIEIRLGPALETLRNLGGPFDLAFIDADKENYLAYYEAVLPLLRPGGLVVVDNVLWSGRVVGLAEPDEATAAIAAFNDAVARDPRVEKVMLTVRDGLYLLRKR
ncbi:MAG: methyltransferase [Deltaproteobacteria bacterium]|nr:MAG: methyltransferase [Deltaproteobacteria bacterium]